MMTAVLTTCFALTYGAVIGAEERAKPPMAKAPFDAATAKKHQAAWAKHLDVPVEITNSIGMKLKLIPAGEFLMGSPEDDKYRSPNEQEHCVRITKPYYQGTTEVTQGQWEKVMGNRPWSGELFVKEGSDNAATHVRWDDAVEFCKKLSAQEGRTYLLPTEAEWEYACRAGTTTVYSFGDDSSSLGSYAWFDGNADQVGEEYAH